MKGLRIYHDKDGVVIEVSLTRPVTPEITKLDGPPRLVIDLPNTLVMLDRKRFAFSGGQLSAVRLDQYQSAPPVARAVADLLAPEDYSVDSAKNKLEIHLHPQETSQPQAAFSTGMQPAAVPVTAASSGSLLLAGSRIGNDSSITAGSDTAIVHLARGGEVRVCPGTSVSVSSSKDGRDLMLGMSTGALETHYTLGQSSSDSILTPDFRILLAGPGEFDYAVSVNNRGDTCVRPLAGNAAPATVTELMGNASYQVKPDERVVFHGGRIAVRDASVPLDCGCPPPRPAVMRASAGTEPVSTAQLPESVRLAEGPKLPSESTVPEMAKSSDSLPTQTAVSDAHPESAPLPASKPNDVHVQVDAPFVFRGRAPDAVPAAPLAEVAQLPILQSDAPLFPEAAIMPPAANSGARKPRGFFSKVKRFFGHMFR